jgi:hypothetical protein
MLSVSHFRLPRGENGCARESDVLDRDRHR